MVTIVRGLPGSGKTTYCKTNFPNTMHLENDMFRMCSGKYTFDDSVTTSILIELFDFVERCLFITDGKMDIVLCCVFTSKKSIERYEYLAKKYNADFQVIRIIGEHSNVHNVPEVVYNSMKNNFQDWSNETIIYN